MVNFSITSAPDYSLYREGINVNDVISEKGKAHGCNAYMYAKSCIQVIPSGGANPTVTVYYWNERNGVFVSSGAPISGKGANIPYEFVEEVNGRIFFVGVSDLSTGKVDIMVSGFERRQFS